MLRKRLFATKSLEMLHAEMAEDEGRLRRVLGPVGLTSLGIGAIIGAVYSLSGTSGGNYTQQYGAVGPDGQPWFANADAGIVFRVDTKTHMATDYTVVATGKCSISISDAVGNSAKIPVTVK